ncbi:hypothetical protein SO574_19160 [Vibrio alfacsensis]|uniref:hypothetical protein n=1 Tax=Vibrio alfacsensis TaxID=1074311 RepID=UPI002ADDF390|nr:hypothetical protein [Vibrio alfacsensis]WQE77892.1 hypothetical protein SO574_19160 [Vibrio alfacsensis]
MINKKFLLSTITTSLILAGCGGSAEGDKANIESDTYSVPSVLNCDDFQATQLMASEQKTEIACILHDKSRRDLSASIFTFKVGNAEPVKGIATSHDTDSGTTTFDILTGNESIGEIAEICITPKSNIGNNNIGPTQCFVSDVAVDGYEKPIVESMESLSDVIRVGNVENAKFTVSDANNGDHAREVSGNVDWFIDGEVVSSEISVVIDEEWAGKMLHFKLTPVTKNIGGNTIGDPIESNSVLVLEKYVEPAPIVKANLSLNGASFTDGTPVEVGDTLSASYSYDNNDGQTTEEAETIGFWTRTKLNKNNLKVDEVLPQIIKTCDYKLVESCDYTVQQNDLSYRVDFHAVSKTINGTTGTSEEVGSEVYGIQISGNMEYLQTLTADVYGYELTSENAIEWYVDTENDVKNDTVRTTTLDTPLSIQPLHSGERFEIAPIQGLRDKLLATEIMESNEAPSTRRGGISDWSWDVLVSEGGVAASEKNANHFVGKDIRLCIDLVDKTSCQNISKLSLEAMSFDLHGVPVKGIAPVTQLIVASDNTDQYVHHRPLTVVESTPLLVKPTPYFAEVNGIKWAQLLQQVNEAGSYTTFVNDYNESALLSCLNLNTAERKWYLPVFDKDMVLAGSAKINAYDKNTVITPSSNTSSDYDGLTSLSYKIKTLGESAADNQLSVVTGWPLISGVNKEQKMDYAPNPSKKIAFTSAYGSATLGSAKGNQFTSAPSWVAVGESSDYQINAATFSKNGVPIISCVAKVSL